MCELFAMSANRPADAGPYLSLLMPRGGKTGPHADGWGVAYYHGRAAHIFKDPTPAAESWCLPQLAQRGVKSTAVVAHIRKANPSVFGRAIANTHPFEREWNGRSWVFAHNGKLPDLPREAVGPEARFQPLGETDSELAFCVLLNAIARRVEKEGVLTPHTLVATIQPVVRRLVEFGEFNFILSDGEHIYVHAHTRLHVLNPNRSIQNDQRLVVLATEPLTDDRWQALRSDRIHVYRQGEDVVQVH